jgi:hypothetical protein
MTVIHSQLTHLACRRANRRKHGFGVTGGVPAIERRGFLTSQSKKSAGLAQTPTAVSAKSRTKLRLS